MSSRGVVSVCGHAIIHFHPIPCLAVMEMENKGTHSSFGNYRSFNNCTRTSSLSSGYGPNRLANSSVSDQLCCQLSVAVLVNSKIKSLCSNGTFYKDIYIKPWARAQTYVVGIWLGYIMFRLRGKKVKLSKLQVAGGWLACTAIAAAILFGIPSWFDPLNEVPVVPGVIYASFHRFGWGLSICWIIFACVYGYGGYVDRFLSWSPLIPLGRLTFCTYLVSLHLQMIYHLTFRQPAYYSRYSMTAYFFNHAVLSLIAGFVCTLLFESPFLQLEKILLPGKC